MLRLLACSSLLVLGADGAAVSLSQGPIELEAGIAAVSGAAGSAAFADAAAAATVVEPNRPTAAERVDQPMTVGSGAALSLESVTPPPSRQQTHITFQKKPAELLAQALKETHTATPPARPVSASPTNARLTYGQYSSTSGLFHHLLSGGARPDLNSGHAPSPAATISQSIIDAVRAEDDRRVALAGPA